MDTTTSGFVSEASVQHSTPTTPPQTPHRRKRRLSYNVSPASSMRSGIRPTETSSPAPRKKATKRHQQLVPDTVTVEELSEADAGYIADIEVVYPQELEEAEDTCLSGWEGSQTGEHTAEEVERAASSPSSTSSDNDNNFDSDSSDAHSSVAEHFSRLDCTDTALAAAEAEFEKKRREKHIRRRAESRVFKRPHSLIINPDIEVADSEAMADHDLPMSARRLRRRVEGPEADDEEEENSDVAMSPTDSATVSPAVEKRRRVMGSNGCEGIGEKRSRDEEEVGNMDVDVDASE